jgi:Cell wall-active antibiotics response 4TMS YvqF
MKGSVALGLVLAGLGVIWLLEVSDTVDLDTGVWVGIVLVGIGIGVIASPSGGARVLLIVLGLFVALIGGALAATDVEFSGGVGDRTESPTSVGELDDPYELGVGRLELDLTELDLDEDTTVRAQIGIGQLVVTVPAARPVSVDAEIGAGDVDVLGEHDDGWNADVQTEADRGVGPELHLELEGGMGGIRVVSEL